MIPSLHHILIATLILVASHFSGDALGQNNSRTWRDANGREIKASAEGFEDSDTIILKLEDGRSVSFPIEKLSLEDIGFAAKLYQSHSIDWNSPLKSEDFVIRSITRERAPGYVLAKTGWIYEAKCIEVKVQYKGEQSSGKANLKAYFYNREGKLIDIVKKPPRRQNEDRDYIDAPTDFKKNDLVESYFPLSEFLEESDWATVLVAFGDGSEVTVATMPPTSFENLDFAEKKMVFPSWKPTKPDTKPDKKVSTNFELEVRRLSEKKHKLAISFGGGGYKNGKQCISAEVRAKGEITPGNASAKLHYFDASGRMAGTRRRPSSAEIVRGETYISNPRIADGSWHPVLFAMDGELETNDYPTFVLVFKFGGKTTALVESSVGATLEQLNFPEKGDIESAEKAP